MNIRIKIADLPGPVQVQAKACEALTLDGAIRLPQTFSVVSSGVENINYGMRLFHLHSECKTVELLKRLSGELSRQLEIISAFSRENRQEIPRFWIAKEGFSLESERIKWLSEIQKLLPQKFAQRIEIEGGIYRKYPQSPSKNIDFITMEGKTILSGKGFTIRSPGGIKLLSIPVGETFHWEHLEDLIFDGTMEFRPGEKGVLIINEISLEKYLSSVNSSEMSADAPVEFLKAQTIAARGTVLATKGCHHYGEPFDLCNGDHCQCYYGSTHMEERSVEATQETAGEALLYRNIIADTRYSKICGGLRETFNNVWEDFSPPYLPSGLDYNNCEYKFQNWRDYILHSPECFCNPMVFRYPDYLADVERFFRWEIAYNEDELAEIIRTKSGSDVREISELIPRQRGFSGRINKLQISGDCDRLMNGELNIRRVLSPSHLPSSCFITEIKKERVILKGAGWGHGVGMCQMGALNMALLGKSYKEILQHYYPKTKLVKLLQPE